MDWLSKNYIFLLLLVLTQKFGDNLADDVIDKKNTIAKVLTNYLQVPWINLNSSWTDEVASTCRNDIVTLVKSADVGEMWAIEMLDAASKIPAGILTGNIWDLGMFDECINVKSDNNPANIQGQHCMVSLSIPTTFFGDTSITMRIQRIPIFNPSANTDLSLSMSVCVPSSCGIEDIKGLVNASIKDKPELIAFEVGVAKVSCSTFGLGSKLTLGSALTFLFFAVVAGFLLICTICDFILRARSDRESMALKNVAKFSVYTNVLKLFDTKLPPDTMPAICGIRVLNICLVIIGHRTFTFILYPAVNSSNIYKLMQTPLSAMIFMVPFAVDTSFIISGFFTAYLFLKTMRSGQKFNMLVVYFHRYLRLTPCIAVLLLFVIFILPYFGSGPNWDLVSAKTITLCEKNWWTNLLYVQNLVNVDEICLLHTWYVAVEMQLLWLSPIILYPLFHRPKFGLVLLGFLLIISFSIPAAQIVINRWSAFFAMQQDTAEIFSEFLNSYPATYNRALPYLIGILLGYDTSNKRRQISKIQVTLNWIVSILFVIFCGWAAHNIQPNALVYNIVYEAIYVSVARLLWSIAMAWVIYACTQGYGGPLTKFLSLPIFVPISRLCYCIYLVHFVLQMTDTAMERVAQYITPFFLMKAVLSDIALSIVVGSILCLCFESPIIALERIITSRLTSPSDKPDPMKKQARFSKAVKQYLAQIRGRVNYDFRIETITSGQDFWQTISDELNNLSEGHSKTSTEWLKTWQVWRRELSKMDGKYEAQSEGIRDEEFQVALEKELMVFLTAVNCRLDYGTSFEKSNVITTISQPDTCEWQQPVPVRLMIIPDSNSFDNDKKSKLSGSISADVDYAAPKIWSFL